jgi:hypothetical protein
MTDSTVEEAVFHAEWQGTRFREAMDKNISRLLRKYSTKEITLKELEDGARQVRTDSLEAISLCKAFLRQVRSDTDDFNKNMALLSATAQEKLDKLEQFLSSH